MWPGRAHRCSIPAALRLDRAVFHLLVEVRPVSGWTRRRRRGCRATRYMTLAEYSRLECRSTRHSVSVVPWSGSEASPSCLRCLAIPADLTQHAFYVTRAPSTTRCISAPLFRHCSSDQHASIAVDPQSLLFDLLRFVCACNCDLLDEASQSERVPHARDRFGRFTRAEFI